MDISKYEKNFAADAVEKDGKKCFSLPCAPFKLYGGLYEEGTGFARMPLDVAAGVSEGVHFADGRGFFPSALKQRCRVDGCHPTDLGFYFMAEKIGGVVAEILHKRYKKEVD